jgi:hypothetical protein
MVERVLKGLYTLRIFDVDSQTHERVVTPNLEETFEG